MLMPQCYASEVALATAVIRPVLYHRTTKVSDRRQGGRSGGGRRSERAASVGRGSRAAVRLHRVVRLTVPTLRIAPSIPSVKSV